MGAVTRDPTIRSVGANNVKLARLSVCINEKRKTGDGKILDTPIFVDVFAWDKMASTAEKFIKKGSNVFVEGKLQLEQWEKDGTKHQKISIRASSLKFIPQNAKPYNNNGRSKETAPEPAVGSEEPQPRETAPNVVPDLSAIDAEIDSWS